MLRVLTISLAVLLAGCASPFVGRWRSTTLESGHVPDDATSMTMVIHKDHTFAAFFENERGATVGGYNGTWTKNAKSQIVLKTSNGPEGTAQLLDKTTLLTTANGSSFKLLRTK